MDTPELKKATKMLLERAMKDIDAGFYAVALAEIQATQEYIKGMMRLDEDANIPRLPKSSAGSAR